jgi:hypothetical protein
MSSARAITSSGQGDNGCPSFLRIGRSRLLAGRSSQQGARLVPQSPVSTEDYFPALDGDLPLRQHPCRGMRTARQRACRAGSPGLTAAPARRKSDGCPADRLAVAAQRCTRPRGGRCCHERRSNRSMDGSIATSVRIGPCPKPGNGRRAETRAMGSDASARTNRTRAYREALVGLRSNRRLSCFRHQ